MKYLWIQLDQNVRQQDNLGALTSGRSRIPDNATRIGTASAQSAFGDTGFDGGFKLMSVKDTKGNDLGSTITYTMMKIELPAPLKTGDIFVFAIVCWFNVFDRGLLGGRSRLYYFHVDDHPLRTIAPFYPRMVVYADFNVWHK